MIARYTHPEMGGIWSDDRRYRTWLAVEIAAAEAMADRGIIPAEAARAIRERGAVDAARVEAIEAVTKHDLVAFTTAVAERVGPEARWLHFGLTSSDVVDTAFAGGALTVRLQGRPGSRETLELAPGAWTVAAVEGAARAPDTGGPVRLVVGFPSGDAPWLDHTVTVRLTAPPPEPESGGRKGGRR